MSPRAVFRAALVYVCVYLTGCSDATTKQTNRGTGVLRTVGIEYGKYISRHRGAPPASEEDFRDYLQSRMEFLEKLNVTDVDQLLISPRDGQPLVVVYGEGVGPLSPGGFPWAVYERHGVEGKRLVASSRGTVVEMDSNQVDEIFSENIR